MMADTELCIDWQYGLFNQLTNLQLFAILHERQKVFVLEQQCLYPDIDDTDKVAGHLTGWLKSNADAPEVAAYLRVIAPGTSYPEVSIGRVLVSEQARGSGLGVELMQRGLAVVSDAYPQSNIKISAQHYLEGFYVALGFIVVSDVYDEDGIPHIDMQMSAGSFAPQSFETSTRVI